MLKELFFLFIVLLSVACTGKDSECSPFLPIDYDINQNNLSGFVEGSGGLNIFAKFCDSSRLVLYKTINKKITSKQMIIDLGVEKKEVVDIINNLDLKPIILKTPMDLYSDYYFVSPNNDTLQGMYFGLFQEKFYLMTFPSIPCQYQSNNSDVDNTMEKFILENSPFLE